MTILTTLSTKELARVTAAAYEGETVKVMLCQVALTGYTAENTVTQWQTIELPSTDGYARHSEVIATGLYSGSEGRYVLPNIDATFTASGVGFTYDRVVIYIDGATYPHSVIEEDPNIVLSPGQTQTYRIKLVTDD